MNYRYLKSIPALAAVAAIFALNPEPVIGQAAKAKVAKAKAAKAWTHPETPWGDPDIQGTWTSDDCIGTGLNRPANFGDRLYLTEQEISDRQGKLNAQQAKDLIDTVADNTKVGTGPPGHWGERARRPCRQTSLVIDPPNGRTPDMLAEAKSRPQP
jgi:hypothetical protein